MTIQHDIYQRLRAHLALDSDTNMQRVIQALDELVESRGEDFLISDAVDMFTRLIGKVELARRYFNFEEGPPDEEPAGLLDMPGAIALSPEGCRLAVSKKAFYLTFPGEGTRTVPAPLRGAIDLLKRYNSFENDEIDMRVVGRGRREVDIRLKRSLPRDDMMIVYFDDLLKAAELALEGTV